MPRLYIFISSILFILCMNYVHEYYLMPIQEIWGFSYNDIGINSWIFILTSVFFISMTMPIKIMRPSGLVMTVLYILVLLPTLEITMASKTVSMELYGPGLAALVIGFCIMGACVSLNHYKNNHSVSKIEINGRSVYLLFFIYLILFFFILVSFKDVINFVGLDKIYEQRELGKSSNPFEAYAQTYLAYVFSPAIYAIGLTRKNYFFIFCGLSGFLLMFGVTAERTIFMLPLAMYMVYKLVDYELYKKTITGWLIFLISLFTVVIIAFREESEIFDLISIYFVYRVVSVPGSMFWQYADVFSRYGYTYWSNVGGLNLFIDKPNSFSHIPSWPQLGHIVAREILNVESNSNANLFAYDGLAGFGPYGVIAISLLLGTWLVSLDYVSEHFEPKFVLTVTFPMAFSLTNGSFFTLLLTFGGLFWLIYFFIIWKIQKSNVY
jgi:oligosaccharide repeat unit polymerase